MAHPERRPELARTFANAIAEYGNDPSQRTLEDLVKAELAIEDELLLGKIVGFVAAGMLASLLDQVPREHRPRGTTAMLRRWRHVRKDSDFMDWWSQAEAEVDHQPAPTARK